MTEGGSPRELRASKRGRRFFGAVLALWIGSAAVFGWFVVDFRQPISVSQFVLVVFFMFSFAFGFLKRAVSLAVPPATLPRLEALPGRPRVAILYTTMNDVVPDCVRAIRQTYPADVFLLDDSSDPAARSTVDALAAAIGFRVVRRSQRRGFKAGAINDWLHTHGPDYDYLVLLDADSVLPPDWVDLALRYAEHPENADLAIFQGMINIWNTDRRFVAALAPLHRLGQDEWERKLAGYLGAIVCYGHNVLIRVAPLRAVGGFDERYVSEDFATAVRLASAGHGSTFVPAHTWEAMPENVRGFVKRQNKWTRGSMEFFSFVPGARIPWHKKLLLLTLPLSHLAYVAIMAAILVAVFGRASTFGAFLAFGRNLLTAPVEYIWSIPLFRFLIVLTVVTSAFTVAKLVQVRLGFRAYYLGRILSRAIGAIMLPHEVRSIAVAAVDRTRRFPVTPKDEPPMSMGEILAVGRGTVALIAVVTLGVALVNPVGLWYNLPWLLPFYTAPLVIHHFCGPGVRSRSLANGGHRELLDDPRLGTAADRPNNRWG